MISHDKSNFDSPMSFDDFIQKMGQNLSLWIINLVWLTNKTLCVPELLSTFNFWLVI